MNQNGKTSSLISISKPINLVNFSRDNRSREVGVNIKNHKNSERCYWMFRDGISI